MVRAGRPAVEPRENAGSPAPLRTNTEETERPMLHTEGPEAWRSAFRIELRTEAVDLALRGWPVFPGSYPGSGEWRGPQPVTDDWRRGVRVDAKAVAEKWHEEPYSVLVATGTVRSEEHTSELQSREK